ncbi:MAG: M48 family metalloprotease [Syntrophomonadaceae bacterium]|nr:M48 family metalloprotease [Syntrophomonadaceae bacterium]
MFICDDNYPNAMVTGTNTIILTTGLINTTTPEELVAVIVHELGHIKNKDAHHQAIGYSVNKIGSLAIGGALALSLLISDNGRRALMFPFVAIAAVLKILKWVLEKLMILGVLAIGRQNEYKADNYAKELGYKDGMISYLRKIQNVELQPKGWIAILAQSHPPTPLRIEKLKR